MFWEITKNNNIYLLDVDYAQEKEYTEAQKSQISFLWSNLGDDVFTLKNNQKMINSMEKTDEQMSLMLKIQGLEINRDLLISLYQNQENVDKFIELKQKTLYNFTLIDENITPLYFAELQENIDLVNKFISSYVTKYKIEYSQQKAISKEEINNVYEIIAMLEQVLNRSLGDIDIMSVSRYLAYEKMAETINESNKATQNGR